MPNMVAFDAPTREKCIIQRQVTNTPLQALVTMNDEQFVEASRLFAERILLEGGSLRRSATSRLSPGSLQNGKPCSAQGTQSDA